MMFKPLEESLVELERCAKEGTFLRFLEETKTFYKRLGVLSKYTVLGVETSELVRHYQQRYDQIKILMHEK